MNEKQQILNITNMNEKEIKKAATAFAKRWEGKGYEKGESQTRPHFFYRCDDSFYSRDDRTEIIG